MFKCAGIVQWVLNKEIEKSTKIDFIYGYPIVEATLLIYMYAIYDVRYWVYN